VTPSPLLELQDVDLIRAEIADARASARLRKLGVQLPEPRALDRLRARLLASVDPRWLHHYERAQARYGRGVASVRARVCQGCFITLPTSAAPSGDESLTTCESCGRILFWR
jgi:predicted  nucleic acid-binding Zn-ribbon protein